MDEEKAADAGSAPDVDLLADAPAVGTWIIVGGVTGNRRDQLPVMAKLGTRDTTLDKGPRDDRPASRSGPGARDGLLQATSASVAACPPADSGHGSFRTQLVRSRSGRCRAPTMIHVPTLVDELVGYIANGSKYEIVVLSPIRCVVFGTDPNMPLAARVSRFSPHPDPGGRPAMAP